MKADGAERVSAALTEAELDCLEALAESTPANIAGTRIHEDARLNACLAPGGTLQALAAARLGDRARPVRALLFDKCAQLNWALGWHQDRTIAVRERFDLADFGPWTVKRGVVHVEPPFSYLEGMITLRAYLDPCASDNGPLRIAPGSHRFGRIPAGGIADVVRQCGEIICLAARGDVWISATSIVHASETSRSAARRRLLMVDYAATDLPVPLEWAGV